MILLQFFQSFRLLCPDGNGRTASVDDYENCNWGKISSNVIMTSAVRDPDIVEGYKTFLRTIEELFGPSGTLSSQFNIFTSLTNYPNNNRKDLLRKNLMFSDMTKKFVEMGEQNYFTWVGKYLFLLFFEYINFDFCTNTVSYLKLGHVQYFVTDLWVW